MFHQVSIDARVVRDLLSDGDWRMVIHDYEEDTIRSFVGFVLAVLYAARVYGGSWVLFWLRNHLGIS